MQNGKTVDTAYIIYDSSGEMTSSIAEFIDKKFGRGDGDYFIHSETTLEPKDRSGRYKVLFVEDYENKRHKVYFKIG